MGSTVERSLTNLIYLGLFGPYKLYFSSKLANFNFFTLEMVESIDLFTHLKTESAMFA